MKIFNVSLRVVITQIAELPDNPPDPPSPSKEPFCDDPQVKTEKMLDRYMDRLEKIQNAPPARFPGYFPGVESADAASMVKNVKVQAETFEDLEAILRMFSDTAKALHAVPDSILGGAVPTIPSMG